MREGGDQCDEETQAGSAPSATFRPVEQRQSLEPGDQTEREMTLHEEGSDMG